MENSSRTLPLYAARALLFAGSAYAVQFTDLPQRIGVCCAAVSLLALSDGEARWRSQMGARAMDLWSGALFGWSALQVYQSASSLCSGLSLAESLDSINNLTCWTAFGLGFSKGIWQFTTGIDEGRSESLRLRGLVRGFCTSLFMIPRFTRAQTPWGQRIRTLGLAIYPRLFSLPARPESSESWILDPSLRGSQEEVNPGSFRRELRRWLATNPDKERVVELIRSTDATLLPLSDLPPDAVERYLDEVASILQSQDFGSDGEIIAEIQGYYRGEGVSYTSERVAALRKWHQSRTSLPSRAKQAMMRIGDGSEGRALELVTALSAACTDNPLPEQNPPLSHMLNALSNRIAISSIREEEEEFELYCYLPQLKAEHYTRILNEFGIDPATSGLNDAIKACGLNSEAALKEAGIGAAVDADQCVDLIIAKIKQSRPQESSPKSSFKFLSAAGARIGQVDLAVQLHHLLSLSILLTPLLSNPQGYLVMAGIGLLAGRDYSRNNANVLGLPIGAAFQRRGEEFARRDFFGRLRLLYLEVAIVHLLDALFIPREVVQGGRLGLLARWFLPL